MNSLIERLDNLLETLNEWDNPITAQEDLKRAIDLLKERIDDQPKPIDRYEHCRKPLLSMDEQDVAARLNSKYPEYGCPFDEPIYAEPSPEPVEKAETELERLKQRVAKLETAIQDMTTMACYPDNPDACWTILAIGRAALGKGE